MSHQTVQPQPWVRRSNALVFSCLISVIFSSVAVYAPHSFAEDTAAQGQALFRSLKSVDVGDEEEVYELTAGQVVTGSNYQLRYNNQFPGEEMHADPGDTMRIQLINELEGISVDVLKRLTPCVVGSSDSDAVMQLVADSSYVTNLHTHGLHASPGERSDNVMLNIGQGNQNDYSIKLPAGHAPGTHWYHAHLHGSTALQVQGGMAGALIVDPLPGQSLNPPGYDVDEHVMVLQFGSGWEDTEDNSGCEDLDSAAVASMEVLREEHIDDLVNVETAEELLAFANQLESEELSGLVAALTKLQIDVPPVLVNGVENPVLDIEQDVTVQRLRVINAGSRNQDYKSLWIESTTHPNVSLPMYVGAFDGVNLTDLPKDSAGEYIAYTKRNPLVVVPGNRADIFFIPDTSGSYSLMMEAEVGIRDQDLAAAKGKMEKKSKKNRGQAKRLTYRRSLVTLRVGGPDYTGRVMPKGIASRVVELDDFLVDLDGHLQELQDSIAAYKTGYLRAFDDGGTYISREIRFNQVDADEDAGTERSFLINDRSYNGTDGEMSGHTDYLGKVAGDGGSGPDGQTPWPLRSGTEEEWTLVNEAGGAHSFHVHVSPFWILDIVECDGDSQDTGAPQCANGADGRLISVRATNPDDPRLNRWQDTVDLPVNGGSVTARHRVSQFTGVYVVHCHILQHEDRGMMINVLTVPHGNEDPQTFFDETMARNDEINREINGEGYVKRHHH